jgi:hypothetical protein
MAMAFEVTAMKTDAAANSLMNPNKRIIAKDTLNVQFGPTAAADVAMAVCYPVAFNKSTGKYAPWIAPDPTKIVVTLTGATEGTWGLTVNGVVIVPNTGFAYNVTAAVIKETLRQAGYEVTVEKAAAVYTITFDGDREIETLPTVAGDVTQITGGTPTAVADAGTATNGTHKIKGFVYPELVTTDQTNDVVGVIMTKGEIAYADIAALIAAGSLTALQTALKDGLVAAGLVVQGLVNVH